MKHRTPVEVECLVARLHVCCLIRAPPVDDFDEKQTERVDVRPWPGGAETWVELFWRAVRQRENPRLLRFESGRSIALGTENSRDSEIEHLHRRASADTTKHQVGRFEIPMDDAHLVRDGECIEHWCEELERVSDRACRSLPELLAERVPVEPFHHDEWCRLATCRRRDTEVVCLHHTNRCARQIVEDPSFGLEAMKDFLAALTITRRFQSQELHGNRLVQTEVGSAIDDAEAALADRGINPILRLQHRSYPSARVRMIHGPSVAADRDQVLGRAT